jgi:hypothetical protein
MLKNHFSNLVGEDFFVCWFLGQANINNKCLFRFTASRLILALILYTHGGHAIHILNQPSVFDCLATARHASLFIGIQF